MGGNSQTGKAWRMLSGTVSVHDVDDLELLAGKALRDALKTHHAALSSDQHQDALQELITIGWALSLDYDPTMGKFSTYAYSILRLRVVDWYRKSSDGRRYKVRPEFLSYEEHTETEHSILEHRVDRAIRPRASDPATDSDTTITRLYAERDSERTRALTLMDQGQNERARRGARARDQIERAA